MSAVKFKNVSVIPVVKEKGELILYDSQYVLGYLSKWTRYMGMHNV